jgi:AcrR family transcriptional regulator
MSPLRADAQRNHDRVLVAAGEAFAAYGPNVSVDEIARRAGVGHGTVFRRFPTKEALIGAVVCDRLGRLAELAEELSDEPAAGEAFERFVWEVADLMAHDRALFECGPLCADMTDVLEAKGRLHNAVAALVSRAQAEGSLRPDIEPADVPTLIGSAIMGAAQAGGADAWRRYVAVVLDGLRRRDT